MHHPTDRIAHTTVFVTPIVELWLEREIAQWVQHERSIQRPIAPRADALTQRRLSGVSPGSRTRVTPTLHKPGNVPNKTARLELNKMATIFVENM